MEHHDQSYDGPYEHPLMDPGNDEADGFDWMATLAAAGVPSQERDLSHMETADVIALLAAEEKAAVDLARAVGLQVDDEASDEPVPADLSEEAQAGMIETVNAVSISKEHLAAQMLIIDLIPKAMKIGGERLAGSSIERAEMLGLSDPGAPMALLARTVAVRRWRAECDPKGQMDPQAVIEAAASAPVIVIEGQPAFDGLTFSDQVDFLTNLPW